jgi:hypothetical protein
LRVAMTCDLLAIVLVASRAGRRAVIPLSARIIIFAIV